MRRFVNDAPCLAIFACHLRVIVYADMKVSKARPHWPASDAPLLGIAANGSGGRVAVEREGAHVPPDAQIILAHVAHETLVDPAAVRRVEVFLEIGFFGRAHFLETVGERRYRPL